MRVIVWTVLAFKAIFAFIAVAFTFGADLKRRGWLGLMVVAVGGMTAAQMLLEPPLRDIIQTFLFLGCYACFLLFTKDGGKLLAKVKKWARGLTKEQSPPPKPSGIMFGMVDGEYITKPEKTDGHVMAVGGVGSGKSSCIAIPTLRAWKNAAFVIDIKGELYTHSKAHRPNAKVFNPLVASSYGYDPYFCLRTSYNPAQEARAIALAIIPLPHEIKDPFWVESAQNLFCACILHYSANGLSFLETIRQMQSVPIKTLVREISESAEVESRYIINSFLDMDDKVLSGIMAEVSKNIVPFITDKNLISALSRQKNITPEDLEYGNDVFVQISEHLLRQWKTSLRQNHLSFVFS